MTSYFHIIKFSHNGMKLRPFNLDAILPRWHQNDMLLSMAISVLSDVGW